jgi:hypothetical protein
MDQPHPATSTDRNVAELADAHDLRSVISAALSAQPVDEQSLRRGVWTYVVSERHAGTSPGPVIAALSELVEAADIPLVTTRQQLTRRVILWSVEAYFGHLGGAGVDRDVAAGDDGPTAPTPDERAPGFLVP